jgi:hypothetical protein
VLIVNGYAGCFAWLFKNGMAQVRGVRAGTLKWFFCYNEKNRLSQLTFSIRKLAKVREK